MRTPLSVSTLLGLAVFCSPVLGQPRLWIVSPKVCPLVDFQEVQPAVDAASDGDIILVRGGFTGHTYGDFTIDGKSVVIAADGIGDVALGNITVRNLALDQPVLLHGHARFASKTESDALSLSLIDNRGPIWVERFDIGSVAATAAVGAARTDSLLLVHCSATGGNSGVGLQVTDSSVYAYESSVGSRGSLGGRVNRGTLFLSGSDVQGASGGSGASGTSFCTSGTNGKDGLFIASGARVYALDSVILGGQGGAAGRCQNPPPFCFAVCVAGANGVAVTGPGTVITLPGKAHDLLGASPILEGETFDSIFVGDPGVSIALLLSGAQGHLFALGAGGLVAVQLPGIAPLVGVMPANRMFALELTMPTGIVPPGFAVALYGQSLFQDPGTRALYVGAPHAWVILDEDNDPLDGCDPTAVIVVDDDAPNDPGPGNPAISDPLENGSSEHPFDAIQEGVDTAFEGGVVVVRDGTYTGVGNHEILINKSLLVESESGAGQCIVQDPAKMLFQTAGPEITLRGLSVLGGGYYTVVCSSVSGAVTIDDCVITSGGVGIQAYSRTNLTVTRSTVDGCGDHGIYTEGSATVDRCFITRNTGISGGGIRATNLDLRNSVIANNTATQGGGIQVIDSATIVGCTFADNAATYNQGHAMEIVSGSLLDTIVWSNGAGTGSQIYVSRGTVTANYCLIEGGANAVGTLNPGGFVFGVGNLTTDPRFVNPAGGDYHLLAGSPCIDAGDPAFVPLPGETDIDGEPRIKSGRVDIGADER